MYYVYLIVEKGTGRRYIGCTSDLRRRMKQHSSRSGARSTCAGNWILIYYEAYLHKKDATIREYKLKQDGRSRRFLYARAKNSLAEQK